MDGLQAYQQSNRGNPLPMQQQQQPAVMSNGAPVLMRSSMRDSWHSANPSPMMNVCTALHFLPLLSPPMPPFCQFEPDYLTPLHVFYSTFPQVRISELYCTHRQLLFCSKTCRAAHVYFPGRYRSAITLRSLPWQFTEAHVRALMSNRVQMDNIDIFCTVGNAQCPR